MPTNTTGRHRPAAATHGSGATMVSTRREHRARRRRRHRRRLTGRLTPVLLAGLLVGTGSPAPTQQGAQPTAAGAPAPRTSSLAGSDTMLPDTVLPDTVLPDTVLPRLVAGPSPLEARSGAASSRSRARGGVAGLVVGGALARTTMQRSAAAVSSSTAVTASTLQQTRTALAEHRMAPSWHPPVVGGEITSGFGPRWGRMHEGLDVAADTGHPLYAVSAGTVTTSAVSPGLGKHVRLTLEDGTELTYGHLSEILVQKGAQVRGGDEVGEVGSTGRSTGAHLHFEVRADDEPVDPEPWLRERSLLP